MSARILLILGLFGGIASATPRNVTPAPPGGPTLYDQHLPVQIIFVGLSPGVACPANPTFDPWKQRAVTAPCKTASDTFSPLDIDEGLIRRMLPASVRPASSRGPLVMAVVPDYRFAYASPAAVAATTEHLFGPGGIGVRQPGGASLPALYYNANRRRIGRLDPSIVPAIDESYRVDGIAMEQYLGASIAAMGLRDRNGDPVTIDPQYPTFVILNLYGQPGFKFHDYRVADHDPSNPYEIEQLGYGGSTGRLAYVDLSAGPDFYLGETWAIDVCADRDGDGRPDQASSDRTNQFGCWLISQVGFAHDAAHLVPIWEYLNPNPLPTPAMNSFDLEPHVFVDPALGYFRARLSVDLAVYLRTVAVNIFAVGHDNHDAMDNVLPYNRQTSGGAAEYYPTDYAELQRYAIQRTTLADPGLPPTVDPAPLLVQQLGRLEPRDYQVTTTQRSFTSEVSDVYECRNTYYNAFPGVPCYANGFLTPSADTVIFVNDHLNQFTQSPKTAGLPILDFNVNRSIIVNTQHIGPHARTVPSTIDGISYSAPDRTVGHVEVITQPGVAAERGLITVHEVGHAFGLSHPFEGFDADGFDYNWQQPQWSLVGMGNSIHSAMNYLNTCAIYSAFDLAIHRRFLTARLVEHIAFLDGSLRASTRANEIAGALDSAMTARAAAIADPDGLAGLDAAYHGYFTLLKAAEQIHAQPAAATWPGSVKYQLQPHELVDFRHDPPRPDPKLLVTPQAARLDEPDDEPAGGCAATSHAHGFGVLAIALAVALRRRRVLLRS